MTSTTVRQPINGVDVPTFFATIDAVKQHPEAAKFQFRAHNTWVEGTLNHEGDDLHSPELMASTVDALLGVKL